MVYTVHSMYGTMIWEFLSASDTELPSDERDLHVRDMAFLLVSPKL